MPNCGWAQFYLTNISSLKVNRGGCKIKVGPSAIKDHISQAGHAIAFKDFSILDGANNEFDSH